MGRITYTSMLNEGGGIKCDLTVTRLEPQRFLVITGGGTGPMDLAWMRSHLPADGSVSIADVTSDLCCVGLWGPRARDLLRRTTDANLGNEAFPYVTAQPITVGDVPALALRISYAGELGWELYAKPEYGLRLWDTLWEAGQHLGVIAAGGAAFDSLRLEKGYRLWGSDIHTEYNPYEAGIGFAVRLDKGEFIGRSALIRAREEGIERRLRCMVMDDPRHLVMGKEPIFQDGRRVGYVTSANFGHTVGKSIAYGYLPSESSRVGSRAEIEYFGRRYPATVAREPLFDPRMTRLKA